MQFHDLAAQYARLKPEIDSAIANVISGGHYILGGEVTQLEEELAADTGRKYCITCGNGTDALVLALNAMGIGPGDAVFVPDFTYFASAGCICTVGARPVPVDISLKTFNICPNALEEAILRVKAEGKETPRAVIPVDLFGQPAAFDKLLPLCEKYGLDVLEDAAQGYGGSLNGKAACSFGRISATSFFPAKPLGCWGDGGAVFTDSEEEASLLRSLRANGRSEKDKYDNVRIGMNSRLDTLQATILIPKLHALRAWELDNLDCIADRYTAALKDAAVTPSVRTGARSSWAQYSILLKDSEQRNGLQAALKAKGIPSMIYYPRGMHKQTAFAGLRLKAEWYPRSEEACARILSLPMHPYLTQEDQDSVIHAVLDFLG